MIGVQLRLELLSALNTTNCHAHTDVHAMHRADNTADDRGRQKPKCVRDSKEHSTISTEEPRWPDHVASVIVEAKPVSALRSLAKNMHTSAVEEVDKRHVNTKQHSAIAQKIPSGLGKERGLQFRKSSSDETVSTK